MGGRPPTERLWVRCHSCGRTFPSPLDVDRGAWTSLMVYERYVCPHCGHVDHYERGDHWFELDITDSG